MSLEAKVNPTVEQLKRVADALESILGLLEHNAYVAQGGKPLDAPITEVPGIEVKVEWRPFKDKAGHWTFSKSNPLLRDTLLAAPNKTLEHGGFKYRLSGEQDMFIQRFAVGPRK